MRALPGPRTGLAWGLGTVREKSVAGSSEPVNPYGYKDILLRETQ